MYSCLFTVPMFIFITGVGEEEERASSGNLWEEKAADQTQSQGWEGCGGEAWLATRHNCSHQVLKPISVIAVWIDTILFS